VNGLWQISVPSRSGGSGPGITFQDRTPGRYARYQDKSARNQMFAARARSSGPSTVSPAWPRTRLRAPSAPTTHWDRTVSVASPRRCRMTLVTPSESCARLMNSHPNRTSAPRSRAASRSIGSSTVCGQFAIGSGLADRYSPDRSALVPHVSDRATSRPASVVTHRLLAMRCCGVATAWNRSLIPRCRKISMVRWLMMCARGVWAVPLCRSTTRCPTPYRDSATDKASPAGPAPTISTGTSTASEPGIDMGRLRLGASPVGWCRTPSCQLIKKESTDQYFIDISCRKR
jgi:hypothetical protein